ncbi:putative membrane protein, DedA family, type II (SNARE domain) [Campylobacter pinnipediorum subsp. caledonicus]|uniref:DedA family protein n=1 Tax=Campylobacter pinnipediorum TaxID=1965231 RepID=UPI0009C39D47|nr:DedA family protein [Campylobacter pinnipediorum]AQW86019.1 putative membrane protein, DedA family, type II (SNARE domain) [Campylobacter pinnipediorum subsp. caledonicus]
MFIDIVNFIVNQVRDWGYFGIFFLMFLESSFFPFPSEIVMIPAGYLASKNEINFCASFLAGTTGSLLGALFNYYLCYFFGRRFIYKYAGYIGLNQNKLDKFQDFFNKHGEISTFNSRLLPGIRQYISLPAGFAKMNIFKFSLYTTLGAGIWVFILLMLGYFFGSNPSKEYMYIVSFVLFSVVLIISLVYIAKIRKK